ncbi:MAG: transporter [Methylococcaceae bacterium]|nr:transporter [Methylococcaceae bacterium]
MQKKLLIPLLSVLPFTVFADHASIGLGVGTASPIATESAMTLPEGRISTGFRAEYIKLDEYSNSKLQDLREADAEADLHSVESLWSLSVSAAYGLTDDLTIGVRVPFIMRDNIKEPEHDHVGAGAEIEALGNVEGIGDTTFYSQYRFFKTEGTNVSALLGIKAPTGKTSRSSAHGLLDTEFQPGSGSWDGILGLAFTQKMGAFSFDASTVYTITSEGVQNTDLGDIFSYNFALSYRVFGKQGLSYQTPKFAVDTIIEFNGEWRDKEETRHIKDANSGGNIAYISPGLRVTAGKNISIGASFGIPVVQDTNGNQVEPDYRVISSINFSF